MATLSDMAFDYSLKRGTGKKAQENFFAGAKAVIREIQQVAEALGMTVDIIDPALQDLAPLKRLTP